MRLRVVPVGRTGVEISGLAEELARRFAFSSFGVEEPVGVPPRAYVAERRQYDAAVILDALLGLSRPGERVLGITGVDLCVRGSGLNFIFGLAQCPGRAAVVSTFRLRPEFYGEKNGGLFRKRILKECVHELGHTFGLDHCPSPDCVMSFSNSIADVDRKGDDLCRRCREELERRGGDLNPCDP